MLPPLSPESPGHARPSALLPGSLHSSEALACRLTHNTADGWAAAVHHLSAQAVHLTLGFLLPVGKEVTVEIHGPTGDYFCRRPARVVHTLEEPSGSFRIWATFLQPLAEVDLRRLLRP